MIDPTVFKYVVIGWIILALVIFVLLLKVTAPYGRHTKTSWGPMVNNRAGWILMELPAFVVFAYFVWTGNAHQRNIIWIFFSLWMIHYTYRVFIFPLRIKTSGKSMPLVIMLFAFCFNFMNGFINGYWFGYLAPEYSISWLSDSRFIIGMVLFIGGFVINQISDKTLLSLRNGNSTGYSIPYGGFFKYISCPNFLGELIQWGGFALMTWCLPSLSFFIWTFVNLFPRAIDHHKWYKTTFPEYPKERKAILPFII